ncbi:MAG: radical SAM protein [Pseudomonadota bacterium]
MPSKCVNCPRRCGEKYFCSKTNQIKINLHQLHYGEEPPVSGTNGSGTIFFSNCNLKCIFCQNYKISHLGSGHDVSDMELINICKELKTLGAHNINFVTPTPYVDKLIPIIKRLKGDGFALPIVWNCGGYESVEMIKELKGLVDVYLPDLKYSDESLAIEYSSAPGYFKNAIEVIKEMRSQVRDVFNDDETMKSGLIVRHLVLPLNVANSKGVLKAIAQNIGTQVYISLMSQYYPVYNACNHPKLDRKLKLSEYDEICEYFHELGFENGFVQDMDAGDPGNTPDFL